MKTLLLPTDFSPCAHRAFRYAAMLAEASGARIELLHVFGLPVSTVHEVPADVSHQVTFEEKRATEALNGFRESVLAETGFPAERVELRVRYGFIADAIVGTARHEGADYIVMGTQGARNLLDRWLGTNAQRVVSEAPCPVLVVPADAPVATPHTVLYAADYDRDEAVALNAVTQFANTFGAKTRVVHIHPYYELPVEKTAKELKASYETDEVNFRNLNRDEIPEAIETYMRTHQPDVLALAVYEKGFWEKLLMPSVTAHFLQHGHVPVLVVRK